MTADALRNGPTWYQDYTLYGMQYGGPQVFSAALDYERSHPQATVIVSQSWANNEEALARFFLPEDSPTHLVSIDSYLDAYWPIDAESVFVLSAEDLAQVQASRKFQPAQVVETLFYPNGQPGFYIARLEYVDGIREIFAGEAAARESVK